MLTLLGPCPPATDPGAHLLAYPWRSWDDQLKVRQWRDWVHMCASLFLFKCHRNGWPYSTFIHVVDLNLRYYMCFCALWHYHSVLLSMTITGLHCKAPLGSVPGQKGALYQVFIMIIIIIIITTAAPHCGFSSNGLPFWPHLTCTVGEPPYVRIHASHMFWFTHVKLGQKNQHSLQTCRE